MEEFEVIEHSSLESDLPRMPDGGGAEFATSNSFETLSLFPMMLALAIWPTRIPRASLGFLGSAIPLYYHA